MSVHITVSGALLSGHNVYSITCIVNGADNLNPSITYQWTKDNGTRTQIPVGHIPSVLSLSPLRLFDAGQYTCQATVRSQYLSRDIMLMESWDVTFNQS